MAFGLYKPGQGYWMRVLTAAMLGTLFLASAMWVAKQANRIVATLPVTSYSVPVRGPAAGPAIGANVVLLGEGTTTTPAPVVGQAVVQAFDPENRILTIKATEANKSYDVTNDTKAVRVDGPNGAAAYQAEVPDHPRARTVVEPVLVQGIAASAVLILGALVTYWLCATKRGTVDFLINTDMEMKKVNWSTRRDVITSTWVVIGSSFLIATLIFVTDTLMQKIFKLIGVLQG